jgi:D-apiose dehydrogenase
MTARLRIGLIGAGWASFHHLTAWQSLGDQATVAAIADPCRENAQSRAAAFGVPAIYTSAEEMLTAGGLDAIDIAAPRALHADLVRLAADHGLAVLCQKPLAPGLAEAEALVREIEGKCRLMVHENWRFRDYYRDAASWLREGRIGRVTAARLTLLTSGTLADERGRYPALDRQPFMRTEERMLVAEVLIHHLDTLRMLLGPLKVTAAALSRSCNDIAGEDGAVIQLNGNGGLAAAIFASFAAYGRPAQLIDQLELLGSEGAIRLDGPVLSSTCRVCEEKKYDLEASYRGSYRGAIDHFLTCLKTGVVFETSPEDNLQTLKLVEDCYTMSGWGAAL